MMEDNEFLNLTAPYNLRVWKLDAEFVILMDP